MKTLLEFLSETNGAKSFNRLAGFVITLVVLFLLCWIVIVQKANITEALVAFSLVALGLKVAQKPFEKNDE